MIVAIDGPAGSGKSTTARRVAERLGWLYLDTGAMYRAVAVAFARSGTPLTDEAAAAFLPSVAVDLRMVGDGTRVELNGDDVTDDIRAPEVGELTSRVSALRAVRDRMVAEQRRVARTVQDRGGVVVEGRDIGTVVFPEADVKVFLVASIQARAERRHAELEATGQQATIAEVADQIARRDERDSSRPVAPLRRAPDAITIDTSASTIDEQVAAVLRLVDRRRREHVPG